MKKVLPLSLVAIGAICLSATQAKAQGYYYPDQTPQYGYNPGYPAYGSQTLGQNVYQIDQYGDQMSHYYALESRNYCGCSKSAALLAEMRRYNTYTDSLVRAYRGTCPKTFRTAACNVRNSMNRIHKLRGCARVSPHVTTLITRSCPMTSYVHTNYSLFRPVPAPVPTRTYHRHGSCEVVTAPRYEHRQHRRHDDGGFDVGSAIVGAIAGRIIHGIIHH